MNLFISWSGQLSSQIACYLREWIPQVMQFVKPYVSSRDITKGARWSQEIASQLEQASFGILCMTRDNLNAPWIHFEAGALSKKVDESNVVPLLFGVQKSQVEGPLVQFQSVSFDSDEMWQLVEALNAKAPQEVALIPDRLRKSFEMWWPQLNKEVTDTMAFDNVTRDDKTKRDSQSMLEEAIELLRSQQRLLSNPENILPPEYLNSILSYFSDSPKRVRKEMPPLTPEQIARLNATYAKFANTKNSPQDNDRDNNDLSRLP